MAETSATLQTELESIDYEEKWRLIELEINDGSDTTDTSINFTDEADDGEEKTVAPATAERNKVKVVAAPDLPVTSEEGLPLQKCNPIEDEKQMFAMPAGGVFLLDMARYRQNTKLNVYPLTQDELYHPAIIKIMNSRDVIDSRLHYYREDTPDQESKGLLTLFFNTKESFDGAVIELKEIRADLNIETMEGLGEKKLIPQWNRESKEASGEGLRRRTVCICNRPAAATKEELSKYFPTAEEVFIPNKHPAHAKSPTYAFAIYKTSEEADAVAKHYSTMRPYIGNTTLGVYKYRMGSEKPEGLLSLHQRMYTLRHGARAAEAVAKLNKGEQVKNPDMVRYKLKRCTELIEQDNKVRQTYGMNLPNHNTLVKSLPTMKGQYAHILIKELGLTHHSMPKSNQGGPVANKPQPTISDPDAPLVCLQRRKQDTAKLSKSARRAMQKAKKNGKGGFGSMRGDMGISFRGGMKRLGHGAMFSDVNGGGHFGGVGQKRPYNQILQFQQQYEQKQQEQKLENLYATMLPLMSQIVQQQQQQATYTQPPGQQGRGGKRGGGYSSLSPRSTGNYASPSSGGQWDEIRSSENSLLPSGTSDWNRSGNSQWNEVRSLGNSLLPPGPSSWNRSGNSEWKEFRSTDLGQWDRPLNSGATAPLSGGHVSSYNGYYSQGYNDGRDNQYGSYEDSSRRTKYARWS